MSDPVAATPPPVRIPEPTTRERPFRRINIPAAHLVKLPANQPFAATPISGRGYDCGCRSSQDYDGKIGQDLGDKAAKVLEKVVPLFAAAKAAKDGLSALVKNIPLIGQTLSGMIDGFDPLRSLLKFIGKKVDALFVDSLVRSIPAWVHVFRNSRVAAQLLEQEVEGFLVRSHQRHDGVPYSQWHLWYDWSFLVSPVGDTAGIVGQGNLQRTSADDDLKDDREESAKLDARRYERGWLPISATANMTIQCEWDLGALGPQPGPFLNERGPAVDWGWPMAGQFFWAAGRSAYDCTHSTSNEKTGDGAGLHLNQLHPLKAIATQRFEGFLFRENRQAVPATQFIFYASNAKPSAGDFRFGAINDTDYDFVVQLPSGGAGVASDDPFSIGATERFLLNPVDVGRRLLVDLNTRPFGEGVHHPTGPIDFRPEITPLVPAGRNGPPTHVRIHLPLGKQLSAGIDNFGIMISLGWHDPGGTLSRRVFRITVTFKSVQVLDAKDNSGARWHLNFGANGRWFQRVFTVAGKAGIENFADATVSFLLSDEDTVTVAAHGFEQDGQGNEYDLEDLDDDPEKPPKEAPASLWDAWMKTFLNSRKLRLSTTVAVPTGVENGQVQTENVDLPFVGPVVDWNADMDQPLDQRANQTVIARASEVARALFLRNARIAFDANDIVGLVDPNIFDPTKKELGRSNDRTDAPNPLSVADLLKEVGLGGTKQCQQTAYAMTPLGRMGMLGYDEKPNDAPEGSPVFHSARVDYLLNYEIRIEAQAPPKDE